MKHLYPAPILITLLFTLPLLVYLDGKGIVLILILTGLAALFRLPSLKSLKSNSPFFYLMGIFLIWSLCTTLWAPSFHESFATFVRFLFLNIMGYLSYKTIAKTPPTALPPLKKFLLAYSILWLFFAFEILTNGFCAALKEDQITLYNRGSAFLVAFTWPALYGLSLSSLEKSKKTVIATIGCIFTFCLLLKFHMAASAAAFIASFLVFLAAYKYKKTPWLIFACLVPYFLLFPFFAYHLLTFEKLGYYFTLFKDNWQHRLEIWNYVSELIMKHPFTGAGLEAARYLESKEHVFIAYRSLTEVPKITEVSLLPLHPHNILLQIWLELGLMGVLCLLGFIYFFMRHLRGLNPFKKACLLATFVSFLIPSSVSFGAWQNWWTASGWLMILIWHYLTIYERNFLNIESKKPSE